MEPSSERDGREACEAEAKRPGFQVLPQNSSDMFDTQKQKIANEGDREGAKESSHGRVRLRVHSFIRALPFPLHTLTVYDATPSYVPLASVQPTQGAVASSPSRSIPPPKRPWYHSMKEFRVASRSFVFQSQFKNEERVRRLSSFNLLCRSIRSFEAAAPRRVYLSLPLALAPAPSLCRESFPLIHHRRR